MSKLPWFKFQPLAWLSDINLSRCSIAAQGAWIRLLCYAHNCDPRGVLASNGKPWSDDEIAHAIGGNPTKAKDLLAELIDRGVASRRDDGAVYSRRMVRDEQISSEGRQHATRRWSPSDPNRGGNRDPNRGANGVGHGVDTPTPLLEERRGEKEGEKSTPLPPSGGGAGAAEIIAQRCGVPTSVRLPESVTPAVVVAHWAEVSADVNVKRPGAVLAARFREGVPSPSLTAKGLIAACNAGKVETVNGVPTAGRKLGCNSLGFYIDGTLHVAADKLGEAVLG